MIRLALRNIGIAFALVAGGIMVANLLHDQVTPTSWFMFPIWVIACLIPAYWYAHRIRLVSYGLRDILGTIGAVLAAIVAVNLWVAIRPFYAMTVAALACTFLVLWRRWLANARGGR